MRNFLKFYRPIVLKKGEADENVFLGTTGSQLTSSQVVDAMNKLWQLYGRDIDVQLPRFTTTNRKLIVTIHRASNQTKAYQEDLAHHMAHSSTVADCWYNMGQGTFRSARAGGIIDGVWASVLDDGGRKPRC